MERCLIHPSCHLCHHNRHKYCKQQLYIYFHFIWLWLYFFLAISLKRESRIFSELGEIRLFVCVVPWLSSLCFEEIKLFISSQTRKDNLVSLPDSATLRRLKNIKIVATRMMSIIIIFQMSTIIWINWKSWHRCLTSQRIQPIEVNIQIKTINVG